MDLFRIELLHRCSKLITDLGNFDFWVPNLVHFKVAQFSKRAVHSYSENLALTSCLKLGNQKLMHPKIISHFWFHRSFTKGDCLRKVLNRCFSWVLWQCQWTDRMGNCESLSN
ncbi:hypothetical protein KIL84_012364 [Mauremys mutica]|uniref:Uncharacterized protein n=1 Tax=Mauremys mutica TaxID=74926 RepID=A0A9D4AW75_9SAUR|nr:hypothetical protein KIL84_012364 [Mauremys mutica]